MFTLSSVRAEARKALGGKFLAPAWNYSVIVVLLVSIISGVCAYIPLASILLTGPLAMAVAAYFLDRVRARGRYDEFGVLVDAAKNDFATNIIISVLIGLYTFFWSLLFIIPGIVKAISYSMAYYVKRDNPYLTASQAITESRRLMVGYKGKYFLLQLSFIGRYILGFFCLFVGILWVSSYHAAANAAFYENLLVAKGIKTPASDFTDSTSSGSGEDRPLWESVVNSDPYYNLLNNPFGDTPSYSGSADSDASGEGADSSKSVNPD